MLGKSDRLSILAHVLGLDEDEFLKRFATQRKKEAAVLRDSVHSWWTHRRQPTKDTDTICKLLQDRAAETGRALDIIYLWNAELTPGKFTAECGTTTDEMADVMSEVCRLTCFEQTDSFPFIRLLRKDWNERPIAREVLSRMRGTYQLFRMHSSERRLCREPFCIEAPTSLLAARATYLQYAEGRRTRLIELSVFAGDRSLHAVGAYKDEGSQNPNDISMAHITIITAAYGETLFAGILQDITDNKMAGAAQRILLVRKSRNIENTAAPRVIKVVKDERFLKYRRFLKSQPTDDHYLLSVYYERMTQALEADLTKEDLDS
jgi:hypothetical protein